MGAGINHFRRKDSLEGSLLGEEVSGGLLFGFFAAAAVRGGAVVAAGRFNLEFTRVFGAAFFGDLVVR